MIFVFDTGALIGLERNDQHISDLYKHAARNGIPMIAPAPVIAEWWKGRTDRRERLLTSLKVEPIDTRLAKEVGIAMAKVKNATLVDTTVMALAAVLDAIVYTSDIEDLSRLQTHFPKVRIRSVSPDRGLS